MFGTTEPPILIRDFMGTIFKFNALTGKFDMVVNTSEIGNTNTYIEVDTTNKRIRSYVDGSLVDEWTT